MRLIAPRGVESGRWFPQTVSCSAGSAQVPDTLTDLIDSGSPNIDVYPFFNNVPHGSWYVHRPPPIMHARSITWRHAIDTHRYRTIRSRPDGSIRDILGAMAVRALTSRTTLRRRPAQPSHDHAHDIPRTDDRPSTTEVTVPCVTPMSCSCRFLGSADGTQQVPRVSHLPHPHGKVPLTPESASRAVQPAQYGFDAIKHYPFVPNTTCTAAATTADELTTPVVSKRSRTPRHDRPGDTPSIPTIRSR